MLDLPADRSMVAKFLRGDLHEDWTVVLNALQSDGAEWPRHLKEYSVAVLTDSK